MNVRQKLSLAAMCIALPALATAQAAAPAAAPAAPAAPSVEVKPYGILSFAIFNNTGLFTTNIGGTAAQDYPGFASAAEDEKSYLASARQTRFGWNFKATGDNLTGATIGGKLEFDFMGPGATSWDSAPVRLRYGYMDSTWDVGPGKLSLLVGQTDGLVNPIHPESVAYLANPLFGKAGNLFWRSPQLRVGFDVKASDMASVKVEVAALNPADGVSVTNSAGNRSAMAALEARLSANVKPVQDVNIAIGVGYHTNQRAYNGVGYNAVTNVVLDKVTESVLGVDAVIDATKYLQLRGEFFTGSGFDDTYAGIGNVMVTGAAGARKTVDASGFWAQGVIKPIPELWVLAGYGQEKEDPALTQIALGDRESNSMLSFGVVGHLSKQWRVGLEYTQTTSKTYTAAGATGTTKYDGSQLALSSQFRF